MIACIIAQFTLMNDEGNYIDQKRYDVLSKMSIKSFKKYHPDVDVFYINDDNLETILNLYTSDSSYVVNNVGILRYILALEIMKKHNYKKVFVLGCDTITTARFDEFIESTEDVVGTLNYPCQEHTPYWTTPYIEVLPGVYDHLNANADVVCFNGQSGLKTVIELSIEHYTHFAEQGGLNEAIINAKDFGITYKIVDFPYTTSNVVYNARSKGVFGTDMVWGGVLHKSGKNDGKISPTQKFYVENDKLYTHDKKQIKCFHIIEALGLRDKHEYETCINDIKENWFNEETKKFFIEKCNCSCFFS